MLAAMEGIKLRALFEPHICVPDEELTIRAGLEHILGMKVSVTGGEGR